MAVTDITSSMLMPLEGEKRWAYLESARTMRFATVNDDGSIHQTPLWFVVDEEKIFIPVEEADPHRANFEAGRPISGLVDSGDEYVTVHGVRVVGKMEAAGDEKLVERLQQMVFDKYFYTGHPFAAAYFDFGKAAGRRYFELVAEEIVGWDMRETTMPQIPEARVAPSFVEGRLLEVRPDAS